ncbi:MAG: InlB B-repeat-containing protein [Solobacterium sp.]|nr:InlB B-repeat-containing protein [Solobacterium sp.]
MNKKVLSVILSALMSVSVLQTPVFAAGEEPEADGHEVVTEVQKNTVEEIEEVQEPEEEGENLEEPAEETPEVAEESETPVVMEVPEETEEPEETPVIQEETEEPEEPEASEVTEPEETEEPAESEDLLIAEEESEEDVVLTETPEEEPEVTLITPEPVTYNGVTVTVNYLSDTFGGKEVTLVVGEPGETEKEALKALGRSFKAVDITFIDEEGNPVQPEEGKNVSVSLEAESLKDTENYGVVHVDGEGNITEMDVVPEVTNTVTEHVKVGETTRTVEVPAETETVEVQDYKEETYMEYELTEQTVEVPAVISYRYVRKSREVEVTQGTWGFFNYGKSGQNQTRTEYYYEKEPYVVREAYTYSTWKRIPVQKTRTVPAGTRNETRVVKEAYSYEVTEDVYEDVVYNDVQTSFEAGSFSVYAVIGGSTDDEARAIVNFYGIDDALINTYFVKNSDQLPPENDEDRDPAVQYIDEIVTDPGIGGVLTGNLVFVGWYISETGNKDYTTATTPKTIDGIRTYLANMDITEGDVVNIYAMIFKVFTITYFDEANISMGSDEVKILSNESSGAYTVNKTYIPVDPTKSFEGWLTDNDAHIADATYNGESVSEPYKMGTTMNVSGDIIFTVSAPKGRWLVFDENGKGATYNAPQFVKDGAVTKAPTLEMQRLGYTFVGWYTERYADDETPDEANKFTFGGELTENPTTIYAKWTSATSAEYTVLYWLQDVSGTGYDFDKSETVTGTVGTAITVTQNNNTVRVTGVPDYTVANGFSYDHSDTGKTVTAEGNTVVNVYINRNSYTLTFQIYDYTYTVSTNDNDNNPAKYGDVNGQKARVYWRNGAFRTTDRNNGPIYNGTVYTRSNSQSWTAIKTITALYEQNISSYFPIVGDNGTTYNNGERWEPQANTLGWHEVMVYIDSMPNDNVTFHLNTANRPLKTMNYYVEALPTDTENVVTHKGTRYVLFNSISARYNGVTVEDFVELDGFARVEATRTVNGDALTPVDNGAGEFYIYDQYYNETIYFFYSRLKYNINFMDGRYFDGNGNTLTDYESAGHWKDEDDIVYGSSLASFNKGGDDYYEPEAAYPGFVFEGWYIDDACTSAYTFTTMPKGGLTVFAKWRQVQYRVFIRPNAKLPDGTNDPSLDWGDSDQPDDKKQAMNFRISYMGQVSIPTGVRDDYEFIGWFLDEETTMPFNDATKLTEDIVTEDYDKTDPANYTDKMNKFGEIEGSGWNSDLTGYNGGDRFWITKKLELYGKWSAILTGAEGIGIIYDANGGSNAPTDTKKYKDNVKAIAQAASVPPTNYRFLYWVVQKWDGEAYVDATDSSGNPIVVYPGDSFNVLKAYAKVTDLTEDDDEYVSGEVYKAYTMQLRAEYGPTEESKDTYIDWYRNWSEDDTAAEGLLHNDTELKINQAVDIYTLTSGVPTRTGYKFLGWAREPEFDLDSDNHPTGDAKTYYEVDEEDLFLKWVTDTEEAHYEAQDSSGTWVNVTQVAADEKMPYHALYAVWGKDHFFIFHSATGVLEAVEYTESIDLTEYVTDGYLYGGYYSAYTRYEATDADKANAEKSADLKITIPDSTYTPETDSTHVGFWNIENAYTAPGTSMKPDAQTVYYLKEVPTCYLRNYHQITYVKSTGVLTGLYLLTAVDDNTYNSEGFVLKSDDDKEATIVKTFSVTNSGTGKTITLTPSIVFSSVGLASEGGGYLGYSDITATDYFAEGTFTVSPFWVTPDEIKVNGTSIRTVTISSLTKKGITKTDN